MVLIEQSAICRRVHGSSVHIEAVVRFNYPLHEQWTSSCRATPFVPEKWPFKRDDLSSGVEINVLNPN